LPGEENNNQFTHFVEKYLSHLVGYVDETFFDVNVLPLDTQNVFVASDNKELHAMYKQHGIEPIPVPWRHNLFHDNGLHCISLCLHRQ
jgi:N-dimethylarginine dimethylaminohydrolase